MERQSIQSRACQIVRAIQCAGTISDEETILRFGKDVRLLEEAIWIGENRAQVVSERMCVAVFEEEKEPVRSFSAMTYPAAEEGKMAVKERTDKEKDLDESPFLSEGYEVT